MSQAQKARTLRTTLLLALLVTLSCNGESTAPSPTLSTGRPVGAPRGLGLLNAQIIGKVLDARDRNTAAFKIERIAGGNVEALRYLLGEYMPTGGHNEFRGKEANPFNILIWSRLVDEYAGVMAGAVVATCADGRRAELMTLAFPDQPLFRIDARFAAHLLSLCPPLPTDPAELGRRLEDLWHGFVGYAAADEKVAFVGYFSGRGLIEHPSASEYIAALFWAMMLNPDFYLEQ